MMSVFTADLRTAAPASESRMGYLGQFQMMPIMLHPIEPVPPAAYSHGGKAAAPWDHAHPSPTQFPSMSDLSMSAHHIR